MRNINKILAVLILSLPLLYVVAYFSLVSDTDPDKVGHYWDYGVDASAAPYYRWESPIARTLFMPVHLIDRRLRPGYWQVGRQHQVGTPVEEPVPPDEEEALNLD
jgi:hypothetical protein